MSKQRIQQPHIEFEKRASSQLSEDIGTWSQEILNELFRSVPEAGKYVPNVVFFRQDPEQGYALGAVVITSATDAAISAFQGESQVPVPGAGPIQDPTKTQGGKRSVVIPVVVLRYMLQPLDILITDTKKMVPLTAPRLREALFRPTTFELMTNEWSDSSLYGLLHPPGRTANEYGSGMSLGGGGSGGDIGTSYGPGMKFAGAETTLMEIIISTLNQRDVEKLSSVFESDPGVMLALGNNPHLQMMFEKLSMVEDQLPGDPVEFLERLTDNIPPHVVQLGYDAPTEQYWVKRANRNYFIRETPRYMSRREFVKVAGEDAALKVDAGGTQTMGTQTPGTAPMNTEDPSAGWSVVEKPGIYKVRTTTGKELMGWVIPSALDFSGISVPMAIFSNGSSAMIQEQIVGAPVAVGVNLPSSEPQGSGVFYLGDQTLEATVPVTVNHSSEDQEGKSYHVTTFLGEQVVVKLVAGLKSMVPGSNEESGGFVAYLPDTCKFMPLEQEDVLPLADSLDQIKSTGSEPQIKVSGDRDVLSFRYIGLPQLNRLAPKTASYDEAVFTLCLAGLSPIEAHGVIKRASVGYPQTIKVAKDVVLAKELLESKAKIATALTAEVKSLRRELVKEAAVLPDIQTVDSVLSLGFINPENIRAFISHLPYLETALHRVCELTLAARLGLTEIPEGAASRAARGLDDVIQGIRALMMRPQPDGANASQEDLSKML